MSGINKLIDARIERALAKRRPAFRARLKRINTEPGVSMVQCVGANGEVLPDLELMQQYGFTASPLGDTQAIVIPLGGRTSQGVIIATEDGQYRIKQLAPGEVAIYSHNGDSIILKNGRTIEITTETLLINATTKVEMNTPLLQVNDGDIKADDISLKHHRNKDVQSGSDISGEAVV
jgi:phage baseplate assembly protein V